MKYDGKLPLFSIFEKQFRYKFLSRIQFIKPLQYVDYDAQRALKELNEICGYEYYGNKHWESRFTKFLQIAYLPDKFNIDKRKSHYSSLIISGQMTRDEALQLLSRPPVITEEKDKEVEFILEQLDITRDEYERIIKEPPVSHSEFKSSSLITIASVLFTARKKIKGY
jgi:hypothetical protein